MKTHFSTFSALVTLLLAISPTNAWTPPIAWTPNIIFQDEQVQNVDLCALYVEVPGWCDGKAIINHDLCMNSNGRRSVEACGGLLTVDFPPETNETTPVHFSAANGSWVGGTSPNKISGNNASMTEIDMDAGTAQWGNANYVGGWCVAHIVQYQKLDPSAAVTKEMAQYSYNISLYDNSPTRQYIGGTSELLFVEDKATQGIDSALPSVFEITSGSADSDPYYISYSQPYLPNPSDEVWDAYDATHQCSMANLLPNGGSGNEWGYDHSFRTNDCGFQC